MKFVGSWTVHIYTVHWKKSTFVATVHWTVAALLQKRVKTKKKKKKKKEQNVNVVYETWIQTEAYNLFLQQCSTLSSFLGIWTWAKKKKKKYLNIPFNANVVWFYLSSRVIHGLIKFILWGSCIRYLSYNISWASDMWILYIVWEVSRNHFMRYLSFEGLKHFLK